MIHLGPTPASLTATQQVLLSHPMKPTLVPTPGGSVSNVSCLRQFVYTSVSSTLTHYQLLFFLTACRTPPPSNKYVSGYLIPLSLGTDLLSKHRSDSPAAKFLPRACALAICDWVWFGQETQAGPRIPGYSIPLSQEFRIGVGSELVGRRLELQNIKLEGQKSRESWLSEITEANMQRWKSWWTLASYCSAYLRPRLQFHETPISFH